MRKEFYGALNSNNANDQQCHLTCQQAQQAHLNQSNNDLLTMIRELKEEVKDLKANRARNYSQNTTTTYRSSPPNNILKFKYCWTHGCNRSHSSQDCRMPANNHKRMQPLRTYREDVNLMSVISYRQKRSLALDGDRMLLVII